MIRVGSEDTRKCASLPVQRSSFEEHHTRSQAYQSLSSAVINTWSERGVAGEEEAVPVEGAPPAGGVKLRDMHGDSSAVQRPGSAGRHPELREDGRSQGAAALENQGAVHCSFLPYTTVVSV